MILSFVVAATVLQVKGVIRSEDTAKHLADTYVASVYEQPFEAYHWKVTLGKKFCYVLMVPNPKTRADDVFVNCDFVLDQKTGGLYFAGRANGKSMFDTLETSGDPPPTWSPVLATDGFTSKRGSSTVSEDEKKSPKRSWWELELSTETVIRLADA